MENNLNNRRAKGMLLLNIITLAVVVSVRFPFKTEDEERRAGTITIKTDSNDVVVSAHADIDEGFTCDSVENANAIALAIEEICVNELTDLGYDLTFEDFTVITYKSGMNGTTLSPQMNRN